MEQIFDFQFSKEVCVCPSKVQANKGGEVTHFVIQIRYTASIVPNGCFPVKADLNCCVFRTHVHARTRT